MARSQSVEQWSTKLFRALVSLYPTPFRDEYHRELTLLFVDRYRAATSWRDRAALWLDVLTGIATEVPREHAHMIAQDIRYSLRSLRRHAMVTATIVVTLGLGIGINSAMFSLLNTVSLRALPVPRPDQLVSLRANQPIASNSRFSGPMFDRLRRAVPADLPIAAMGRVARVYTRIDSASELEPAFLQLVSSDYFRVLDLKPALGQLLPLRAQWLENESVAVISYAYWQRRFSGARDVVGRVLTINGSPFTIVGVAPERFTGVWLESPVDVWTTLEMQPAIRYSQNFSADGVDKRPWHLQDRVWWLDVIARVPGQAAAALGALNGSVADLTARDVRIEFVPFESGFSVFRRRFETPLLVLIGMSALVLLAACANVANLLLARSASRQRDLAVRMSIGAGRARLVRQLITECLLLVLMSCASALLFAHWAGNMLVRLATSSLNGPPPFSVALDLRVLLFTALVALVAVILFGVLPAWRATRIDLVAAIKASGRGSAGRAAAPARALVVVQVALSLVLVTGTGLLARSFYELRHTNVGIDTRHVLAVSLDPRLANTTEDVQTLQLRVLDSVVSVPGVTSASLAMCGIQSNCAAREDGFKIEGYNARVDEKVVFLVNSVTPSYFSTVGMSLLAGRPLNDSDIATSPRVAVVNRALATRYFDRGDAVGKQFSVGDKHIQIVGIVDDALVLGMREAIVPGAFFPLAQLGVSARALDVRVAGDPRNVIAAVRAAISRTAPQMPIETIVPMADRIDANLSQDRLIMLLSSGFGLLALTLAGFGLFGLLSYAVARRSTEFGIRMALGASRQAVVWSVVREALWLVTCGLVIGAPCVMLGGRMMSSIFAGVSATDWATAVAAAMTLTLVGTACSLLPALKASRVDPLVALRQD